MKLVLAQMKMEQDQFVVYGIAESVQYSLQDSWIYD